MNNDNYRYNNTILISMSYLVIFMFLWFYKWFKAGAKVMSSLQRYARVPCGYAAVKDVRTSQHEDQMDSFVLSETFKYLYLLFSSPEDLPLQVDDFVFTTEAHLLPLSLARLSNLTSVPLRSQEQEDERNLVEDFDVEHAR